MGSRREIWTWVRWAGGAALLAAGLAGLTVLAIFPEPPSTFAVGRPVPGKSVRAAPALTGWDDARITRRPNESHLAFAHRATMDIFRATYACLPTRFAQSAPAWIAAHQLRPEIMAEGFLDASILNCGFCHQRAFLLANALDRAGFEGVQVWGLNGHVVTRFFVQGQTYFADPDYGLSPFALDANDVRGSAARAYADVTTPEVADLIAGYYASEADNQSYESIIWLRALADHQLRMTRRISIALYILIGLLAAGGVLLLVGDRLTRLVPHPRAQLARGST